MQRIRFPRQLILSVAACGFLTVLVQGGCAESEDIEAVRLPDAGGSATGGSQTQATGGSQGSGTGGNTQSGGSPGSGGSNGSGGFTATGGSPATGGSLGTGGGVATGGTVGTGGSRGTGGVLGSGGMTGNGGARATGGTVGTGGAGGAGAAVTFTQVYQMVLTPKCAGSSCHSPGTQGGVSFASQSSAYSAVKGRVAAGNANGSSFYTLLTSGQMPRGQAKLSTTLLNLVAAWINAGALNN